MKIKSSRSISFLVVLLIYILATAIGIITYKLLPFSFYLNLLIADIVATIITFVFSVIFKNASVYDPYWSVQPIVIAIAFIINCNLNTVKIATLIVILIWGTRLTLNWAYTFKSLEHQDWRYTMLKETTGKFYPIINFVGIHLVPTLIVYLCVLPAVFTMLSDNYNLLGIIPLIISVLAVILQGTADWQMHKYRRNKPTKFIRNGLWKHSRHPNYLGEILMWFGIGISAIVNLGGNYYLIVGAVLNLLLFMFVSIPLADNRQSSKEGFSEYKKETRALLPIKKFKG